MANKSNNETLQAAPPSTSAVSGGRSSSVSYSCNYNSIPTIEKPLPVIPALSEHEAFLASIGEAYEALRVNDPTSWEELQNELTLWDTTVKDGLEEV